VKLVEKDVGQIVEVREVAKDGEARAREAAKDGEARAREAAMDGEARAREAAMDGEARAREAAMDGEAKAREAAMDGEAKAREAAKEGFKGRPYKTLYLSQTLDEKVNEKQSFFEDWSWGGDDEILDGEPDLTVTALLDIRLTPCSCGGIR
jgi:hypothetical protein